MQELVIGACYKHFKGHVYKVLCLAKDADDLSDKVVYQNIQDGDTWVRDKTEFLSEVDHDKYPQVEQKYRFELIEKK